MLLFGRTALYFVLELSMLSLLVMLTRELGGMFLYQFIFLLVAFGDLVDSGFSSIILLIFVLFRRNFFKEKLGHLLLREVC